MPHSSLRHLAAPAATLALLAGGLAPSVAPARSPAGTAPGDSAGVATTVARFHASLAAGDSAGALALLAPDATVLESGDVETAVEYRGHHLPADIGFARAVRSVRGPVRVTVHGDAAWASSTDVAEGVYRGRAVNSAGAELMVLTRAASGTTGWRIAAIHWSSRPRRP